jgi:hypothetical protein
MCHQEPRLGFERVLEAFGRVLETTGGQLHPAEVRVGKEREPDGAVHPVTGDDSFDGEEVVPGFSCQLADLLR